MLTLRELNRVKFILTLNIALLYRMNHDQPEIIGKFQKNTLL